MGVPDRRYPWIFNETNDELSNEFKRDTTWWKATGKHDGRWGLQGREVQSAGICTATIETAEADRSRKIPVKSKEILRTQSNLKCSALEFFLKVTNIL